MTDLGIDPGHFRTLVIRPTLQAIGLHGEAAEALLLGTAITESRLRWLKQHGKGPALGLYQIEPATHDDLWAHFLNYKGGLAKRVLSRMVAGGGVDHTQLVWNLAYATAMARLIYYRRREPLPHAGDLAGLAAYWKAHFNTVKGAGTAERFIADAGPHLLATA